MAFDSHTGYLFFDAKYTGHHGEYLENIIAGLGKEDSAISLILCHPLLFKRLANCKVKSSSEIQICILQDSEVDYIESSLNQIHRGERELKVLEKYLHETGKISLVLMDMNLHQLALSNWKYSRENKIRISGILFNPLTPPNRKCFKNKNLTYYLTRLRKKLQIFLLLRNKSIKRVFILNDIKAVNYLNSWSFSRNVFRKLIDPIPSEMSGVALAKVKNKLNNHFRFILTGAISPRKGCLEVIKALSKSKFPEGQGVSLHIMGAFSEKHPEYEKLVLSEIQMLEFNRIDVQVKIKNEFIDNEAFCREISDSDCVLAPYVGFYGSSGMIGHACRYGKPLLVSSEGLMGEIIRDRKLGLCVDPKNINALSLALEKMILSNFEYSKLNAKEYFEEACHFKFAQDITKK